MQGSVKMSNYKLEKQSIDMFNKRIKVLGDIFVKIREYFSHIHEYVQKYSSEDNSIWESANESYEVDLKSISSVVQKLSDDNNISDHVRLVSDVYTKLGKSEDCVEQVMFIINNDTYTQLLVYNMSQTYSKEIAMKLSHINKLVKEYKKQMVTDGNNLILPSIFANIDLKNNVDEISKFIEEAETTNDFIVYLSRRAVIELDKSHAKVFIKKVESLKDNTLGASSRYTYNDDSAIPMVQRLVVSYNLVPVSEYCTLEKLFENLGVKYDKSKSPIENIKTELRSDKNVVVIHKLTSKLTEYKLRPLIDYEYVKNEQLETSTTSGVNNRILKRFDTISSIATKIPTDAKETIQLFKHTSDILLLLECVNYKFYRILSDDISKKTINMSVYEKISSGLSSRSGKYNKVIEDELLSKGIDGKHQMIMSSYTSDEVYYKSSDILKKEIVDDGVKFISKESIKSVADMKKIFMSDDTLRSLIRILTDKLSNHLSDNADTLETNLTFIAKLDQIVEKFKKEYNNQTRELFTSGKVLQVRFGDLSNSELTKYILGWFTDIMKVSVDVLDVAPVSLSEIELSLKEHVISKRFITK